MLEKIKNLQDHPLAKQLRDIRVIGFMIFGIIVLLVSYSGVSVIQSNFELEKQVARLEQQNQVSQLQNDNLRLTNEYFKSDQYLELQARKQYNKGLEGETLLLVPKNVALSHTIDLHKNEVKTAAKTVSKKPLYQRNFEAWRNFLTHRPQVEL